MVYKNIIKDRVLWLGGVLNLEKFQVSDRDINWKLRDFLYSTREDPFAIGLVLTSSSSGWYLQFSAIGGQNQHLSDDIKVCIVP